MWWKGSPEIPNPISQRKVSLVVSYKFHLINYEILTRGVTEQTQLPFFKIQGHKEKEKKS